MGELFNLGLVLTILAALLALDPKLATSGQMVVASLSTTFVAVAFWRISHYLSTKCVTTCYQQKKTFCAHPSFLVNFGMIAFEE